MLKYIVNRFLWITLNIALSFFYRYRRRIHAEGLENVPRDRPVILCSNHTNAFMDALIVATSVPQRTRFLVRSDVFRKKWQAKALEFLYLIPIYRIQEGVENLSKNDETFDQCNKHLSNGDTIIIFSEGICIQERRLRKLKKGTARIAFGSEEAHDFKLGIVIVPVGINYHAEPWRLRRRAHVRFGKPFEVKKYEERYRTEKAKAINAFTADLEQQMKNQLVIINDPSNDKLVAILEELFLEEFSAAKKRDPHNQRETHHTAVEIAERLNKATSANPGTVQVLAADAQTYSDALKKQNLRDWLFRKERLQRLPVLQVFGEALLLLLFLPVFGAGLLINALPFFWPFRMANKIVKNMEWHASLNVTIGTYIAFFWYVVLWILTCIFVNWWVGLIVFASCYPLGLLAWEWWCGWQKWTGKIRFASFVKNNRNRFEELAALRKKIRSAYDALGENA